MASEQILAARRTQAMVDQARALEKHALELAEVNRKLDLIMEALHLVETKPDEFPQSASEPEKQSKTKK
jgi:hypothetical protein